MAQKIATSNSSSKLFMMKESPSQKSLSYSNSQNKFTPNHLLTFSKQLSTGQVMRVEDQSPNHNLNKSHQTSFGSANLGMEQELREPVKSNIMSMSPSKKPGDRQKQMVDYKSQK